MSTGLHKSTDQNKPNKELLKDRIFWGLLVALLCAGVALGLPLKQVRASHFNIDSLVILLAWIAAMLFAKLAYYFGGEVWEKKFQVKDPSAPSEEQSESSEEQSESSEEQSESSEEQSESSEESYILFTGFQVEVITISMVMVLLLSVNALTSQASLMSAIQDYRCHMTWVLGIAVAAPIGHIINLIFKTKDDPKIGDEERSHLLRGYFPYFGYSFLSFAAMLLTPLLLYIELEIQGKPFDTAFTALRQSTQQLHTAALDSAAFLVLLEDIYGQTLVLSSQLLEQLNIVLITGYIAIIFRFVFSMTRLQDAYEAATKTFLNMVLGPGCALVICVISAYVYAPLYTDLFRHTLHDLHQMQHIISSLDADVVARYYEILSDLHDRSGTIGLIERIVQHSGGPLILLGVGQWYLEYRDGGE